MNMNLKDVFDCYSDDEINLKDSPSSSDDRVSALTNTKLGKENFSVKKPHRRLPIILVTVVAVVLLMGAGVVAASDSIDSWFKYRWEKDTGEEMSDAQYEYVASLSQYIGLSQSSEGVTVTVDSAASGDNIVYILVYVESDDSKFAPKVSATSFETSLIGFNAPIVYPYSYVGTTWQYTDEDGRICFILEKSFEVDDDCETIDVTLHLEDFFAYYAEDTGLTGTFNGGVWDFEFTLERTETHLVELEPPESWTGVYEFSVTEFSVYAVYDYPDYYGTVPDGIRFLKIYAVLEDGTEVRAHSSESISNPDTGLTSAQYNWAIPVDLGKVVGIRVGEEMLDLE
ncbi:MAG: DUF4179 domain-containing protein [Oscillospiraceae bacterium]|nr:DUF4179 domain-containing protein [Oscillospiraceae bacterium]